MIEVLLEIIQTPAIVMGIVTLIGLAVQRKPASKIFSGTVKTALGLLILSFGAGIIVEEIVPFSELFTKAFNLTGFATSSEAVVGAMQNTVPVIASTSALIMAFGFLVNIILAKFTPLKYIFLTGHMMWILSVAVAFVLYDYGYSEMTIIVFGSIIQGTIMTLLPAIAQPMVRKVLGSDNFALGHLTLIGTVASGYIGGLFGNKEQDAEELELPESLEFFKDTSMAVSIIMGIFYLIIVLVAGPNLVSEYAGETNYILFGLMKALGFTAGVLVLMQGVRMFLGELVPAFKGISDKLVVGSIPALDVPALFTFAPKALMLGFITSIVGMLVAMFISSVTLGVVPLVSIIGAFFTGGIAGIFGNATGGRRGASISGFMYGFFLIYGSSLVYKLYDFAEYGSAGVGHDTTDVMVTLGMFKSPIIGMTILVVVFILMSIYEIKEKR